jgi:hypothetical protein
VSTEILASRETFTNMDATGYWQRAKSGNFYVRASMITTKRRGSTAAWL